MKKIGIIGQGFVGNAVYQSFKNHYNVLTYDIDSAKCNSTLKDVVSECDYIFMCLPSPMGVDGICNTMIVSDVLYEINEMTSLPKVIILKSTVPPYTCHTFNELYPMINIVFNPEFLTAVNAVEDFRLQDRIILGGDEIITKEVAELFEPLFPFVPIIRTTWVVAEMTKYVVNCFLAMKVSFANEIHDYCQTLDIPYDEVISCATLDKRLGSSHWQVPGYDGHYGFGGTCFPKDVNAMIYEMGLIDVDATMLKATWAKNLIVRPEIEFEDK